MNFLRLSKPYLKIIFTFHCGIEKFSRNEWGGVLTEKGELDTLEDKI
jgi:hypothetical protein